MSLTPIASGSCQIAQFLSPAYFEKLEQLMYTAQAAEGSHLFLEGDRADRLYYVIEGQVKVSKMTEDGKELVLYLLQSGDLFGEIGGFGEVHHTLNAEVLQDSKIGVIQQKDLEILIYQHGEFAVQFMKWMGLVNRTTQSKFRDLMLYGKTGALASTIIRLSNSYGTLQEDGIRIGIQLTNTDLANLIGTTRESVNRLLSSYKDDGVISYDHGHLVIHKLHVLRSICHCGDCPLEICRI